MENQVQQFLNDNFGEVRAVNTNNNLWFVASDISKVLEYDKASDMTRNIDDEDKDTQSLLTLGGVQKMLVISESGLYSAVLSITKRNAARYEKSRKFKRWITSVVIPTLRKDGMYVDGEEKVDLNNEEQEAEFILKAMTLLQNKIDRLQKENQELKPKADYTDKVLNPTTYKKLITTTDIAKDLGMSAMKLNKLLNSLGVIYKQSGNWYLYSQHQDKVPEFADYVVNEHGQSLKWTEKGRKFIIEEIEKLNKVS